MPINGPAPTARGWLDRLGRHDRLLAEATLLRLAETALLRLAETTGCLLTTYPPCC